MGLLDRLLGRDERPDPGRSPGPESPGTTPVTDDERAVQRYQYLLRTAPPDQVEQAHAEAFARLTPEQRQLALEKLATVSAPGEVPHDAEPATLARSATRAEMGRPGALQQAFGGGAGLAGGAVAGVGAVLLTSVAGAFVGTAAAQTFLGSMAGEDTGADGTQGSDGADAADGAGQSDPETGAGNGDGFFDGGFFGTNGAGSDAGGIDAGGFDGGF